MIQFNLLPDIKIHYLKARRQKHLVVLISVVASVVSAAIFILLFTTVFGLQKKNIADLNKDITASSKELQEVPELNKILTVQNQLGALTGLHDKKVVSSRLLDYLTQVTPAEAKITKFEVDYALSTMEVTGTAPNLGIVNKYTDTLKFTKFVTEGDSTEQTAFSNVVLGSFSRDAQTTTYTLKFKYDPIIFSNAKQVTLKVPKIITTRSETAKPAEVFQGAQ